MSANQKEKTFLPPRPPQIPPGNANEQIDPVKVIAELKGVVAAFAEENAILKVKIKQLMKGEN